MSASSGAGGGFSRRVKIGADCMKITTTGRKCTLRPAFVERTETKLSKMDKFFDSAASADVTVSNERNKQRVEITIRCNGCYSAPKRPPRIPTKRWISWWTCCCGRSAEQNPAGEAAARGRFRSGSAVQRAGGGRIRFPGGQIQDVSGQASGCGRGDFADEYDWASVLYVPQHGDQRGQRGVSPQRRELRPA